MNWGGDAWEESVVREIRLFSLIFLFSLFVIFRFFFKRTKSLGEGQRKGGEGREGNCGSWWGVAPFKRVRGNL